MYLQILECEFYLLELMVSVELCVVAGCSRLARITYCFLFLGLLPDRVPPVQTAAAVRAGYGTGRHAAAAGLVRRRLCFCLLEYWIYWTSCASVFVIHLIIYLI